MKHIPPSIVRKALVEGYFIVAFVLLTIFLIALAVDVLLAILR